ncbi:hypothetical protein [Mesorhizobium sp. M0435]|uniref:hypothetical protein n=1 Tax=Mesorhizobium sp. M0435 TaxID=2956944 RepID=UPI00333B7F7C
MLPVDMPFDEMVLRTVSNRLWQGQESIIGGANDELTGVHNRRGFAMLAKEVVKRAARTGTGLVVTFIDLDGMKPSNGCRRGSDGQGETIRNSRELGTVSF